MQFIEQRPFSVGNSMSSLNHALTAKAELNRVYFPKAVLCFKADKCLLFLHL